MNRNEVLQILQQVYTFHNYAYLTTVYTCGLRLQEALYLQTSDIDSKGMMIHVHRGKGAKDQCVPLPEEILALIAHSEKVFSLFEPHTEWISKGKAGVPVELGLKVCIIKDQNGLILHPRVIEHETDDQIAVTIIKETKEKLLF